METVKDPSEKINVIQLSKLSLFAFAWYGFDSLSVNDRHLLLQSKKIYKVNKYINPLTRKLREFSNQSKLTLVELSLVA